LYVEPDYLAHALLDPIDAGAAAIPNDPKYEESWYLESINAKTAWRLTTGSPETKICVIDSGIDADHPDLRANVQGNVYDMIHKRATIEDYNGHGTHCSGVIGAQGNNSVGITGIMWHSNLLGCRFMRSDGAGYLSHAIECLSWCVGQGAKIISNSWGTPSYSQALKDVMESLASIHVVTFVSAAGNSGENNDGTAGMYPASFSLANQISVGATDREGALARFSNYGTQTTHIGAPGVRVVSTLPDQKYGYKSGTSMAAPQVAGTLGLMLAVSKNSLSSLQLKQTLLDNSKKTQMLENYIQEGNFLDVGAAVMAAYERSNQAGPAPIPKSTNQSHPFSQVVSLRLKNLPFSSKVYSIIPSSSSENMIEGNIFLTCPTSKYPIFDYRSYLTDLLIPKRIFSIDSLDSMYQSLTIDTCSQSGDVWDSMLVLLECTEDFNECSCYPNNDGCGQKRGGSKVRIRYNTSKKYIAIVMPTDPLEGGEFMINVVGA